MKRPKVSIIVLNWNGKRFLKDCLDSVFKTDYNNYEVIFVDNASSDNSVIFVKKRYKNKIKSKQLKIIVNDKNYGFAKGNNIGIEHALKDKKVKFVVTLNNDTKVDKNWLKELVKLGSLPKIGSVAAKMVFFDRPSIVNSAGCVVSKYGIWYDRGFNKFSALYTKIDEVFGPCAGAALYTREALGSINIDGDYFDSDFFAYSEDTDLAWRLQLMGWSCLFCPSAKVWHVHAGTTMPKSKFSIFHGTRNSFLVIVKNFPGILLLKYFPFIFFGQIAPILSCFYRRKLKNLKVVLHAEFSALKVFNKMICKRKKIQNTRRKSVKEIDRLLI